MTPAIQISMIKLLCKLVELNVELLKQLGGTVTHRPDFEMMADAREVIFEAKQSLESLEHK